MFGKRGAILLVVLSSFRTAALRPEQKEDALSRPKPVRVAMNNVAYHFTDTIAVHIRSLQGELVPKGGSEIVVFDDKESFLLTMKYAEIAMNVESLSHVLNENVFADSGSPIRDVTVRAQGNSLLLHGKLKQKGGIPFEAIGNLSVTADGRIRLHTNQVKAAHLPVKGLMDLLGLDIARLIDTHQVRGVAVEKDDVILDVSQILPPPHIQGRVTAVSIEENEIVQRFGKGPGSSFVRLSGNYMAYRDNDLRFGKLTMHDTDMVLIDMNPRDPFDFYLDHYKEQLVAGYSKTTPTFGLRVFMRDFNKLAPTK